MLYYENEVGDFTPWRGEAINGVFHPLDIERLWSDTELASVNLYKLAPSDKIPLDHEVVSTEIKRVNGEVKPVHVTQQVTLTNKHINKERARRVEEGKVFTLSDGKQIRLRGDKESKTNLLGLALAAVMRKLNSDNTITPFRDADNIVHDLSPDLMFELWSKGSAHISDLYKASWGMKDAVDGIPSDYREDIKWT